MKNKQNYGLEDQQILGNIINAISQGQPLSGENGVITKLIKQALETALNSEVEQHIAETSIEEGGNRKNGKLRKMVKSQFGEFELETPRDRNSSFDPQIVRKRQTFITDEIDNKILSLYGVGVSYEDIKNHIQELYGCEVSPALISSITDKLLPKIQEWRTRPLEDIYPIVFLDVMFFKANKDGKVQPKDMYNIMGIDQYGKKEILGFYVSETEGAHFWVGVLNDLKNRGINDILIACIDGLKGFPEAIETVFPKTQVQLCVVHQIRNSIKFVASKDQKEFMQDLKLVYQASSKKNGETQLLLLDEKWGKKYPMVIRSWQNNWDNISTYFQFSEPVRKLIYTTNPIEGFHRMVRKYTKTKGAIY